MANKSASTAKSTSTNGQFPFVFDAEKMKEMFQVPDFDRMFDGAQVPGVDMEAMVQAYQKNVAALVEANKAAMAGYQELYKRQVALAEESLAKAKDQILEMQSQPASSEQATKNIEAAKAQVEKVMNDIRELAEMAQKANNEAFGIIKARFDEAMAETQAALTNKS